MDGSVTLGVVTLGDTVTLGVVPLGDTVTLGVVTMVYTTLETAGVTLYPSKA